MKNLSLALNGVLLVAVVILYVLHFSADQPTKISPDQENNKSTDKVEIVDTPPAQLDLPTETPKAGRLPIGYVNIDSVNLKYEYIVDVRDQLDWDIKQAEKELAAEELTLRKEVETFYKLAQAGSITEAQAQQKQMELAQKEQALLARQAQLREKLADKQFQMQEKLNEKINVYLDKFNEDLNYSYILWQGGPASSIVYAKDSLDLTREIIKGLNADYRKSKK